MVSLQACWLLSRWSQGGWSLVKKIVKVCKEGFLRVSGMWKLWEGKFWKTILMKCGWSPCRKQKLKVKTIGFSLNSKSLRVKLEHFLCVYQMLVTKLDWNNRWRFHTCIYGSFIKFSVCQMFMQGVRKSFRLSIQPNALTYFNGKLQMWRKLQGKEEKTCRRKPTR